ncbi:MAG: extracellular solute-binding protein [Cyanobacteria bacterium J06621_11]
MRQLITLQFSLTVGILFFLSGCGQAQDQQIKRTVTILGVIEGEQQQKLEKALAPFEAETNIDVIYEGSPDFATMLKEKVGTEDEPDLAMFPQPGLMAELAESGDLIPLSTFLEKGALQAAYSDTWIDLGTVEDETYAVWYRTSVKSLV